MGKFRTRLIGLIIFSMLFAAIAYMVFFLQIADFVFKAEMTSTMRNIVVSVGLLVTGSCILVGLAVAILLSRGIIRTIDKLTEQVQALARGNFEYRIAISSYSELETLVTALNSMAEQESGFRKGLLKRSQNLERLARARSKELEFIYKMGQDISATLELDEVLDAIVKRTAEVLELKTCTILLVDEADVKLEVARVQGIQQKKIERQQIKKGEGISGWVWNMKEPLLVRDVDTDRRFSDRKKEKYYSGSLISVPLEVKGKIIGVIVGNNKVNGAVLGEEDLFLLKEIAAELAIAIENALLYKSLKEIYVHTISALASALEAKDQYMHSHSENVTIYAVAIAEEMNLPPANIEVIRQACQLHDLGKIGIHDYILTKMGKLSPQEWEEIKMHSLKGAQIIQPIGFLSEVADLIRQHHERYDGHGYPYKLSGEGIKIGARIMSVADAFDAMLTGRPYRKALNLAEATQELKANSGTQFDTEVVEAFLKVIETKPEALKLRPPES